MADSQITLLPAGTVVQTGDLLAYVDISGTPTTKKGTVDILATFLEGAITLTGEVTGNPNATALGSTSISNKALIAAAGGMEILVNDAGTLKKVDAADLLGGGGGTTINPTDGILPYRLNGTTFADSLLRYIDATTMAIDTETFIFAGGTPSDNDSIRLITEADGTLVFDGLTGGLFSIIDDKDNELWTASDVSGNPVGYIDADWLVQFGNPFNRPFKMSYNNATGDTHKTENAQRYTILNLVDYADDTAAGAGGLVTGDLYRTTATKSIAVKD